MRIAIYARVSTDDKGQDPENQLRQLRDWCGHAGHELVHEYIDRESGRKGVKERKQFARLFEDAHQRRFKLFFPCIISERELRLVTHRMAEMAVCASGV
jgi:DNA invertase Pin-like site-specific DNA recombinase